VTSAFSGPGDETFNHALRVDVGNPG